MDQNQNRYLFQEAILSATNGTLFHGRDLALNRNIFLYQLHKKGSTSDEEYKKILAGVSHYTDPSFFHILDLGMNSQGVFAVVETRDGGPLCKLIQEQTLTLSFDEAIRLVVRIGAAMQDALEERVHGFSLAADNIWISGQQAMIMNYWTEGEKRQRGAMGLIHLLFQLICRTDRVPNEYESLEERLKAALQKQTQEEKETILRLFKRTYSGQDSVSSIILELNMLLRHPVPAMKEIQMSELEGHAPTTSSESRSRWKKSWIWVASILLILTGVYLFQAWGHKPEEAAVASPKQESPAKEVAPLPQEPIQDETPSPPPEKSETQEEILTVPNLIGLTKEEAEKLALENGLHYRFFLEPNEQEAGSVFKQDLEAGMQVPRGSQIQFWISKGP